MAEKTKIIRNAICTHCGCLCDDIHLSVKTEQNVISKAENACRSGRAWFIDQSIDNTPPAKIDGQVVKLEEAIEEAAKILIAAKSPLIYGLSDISCEGQRQAVAIADRIRGNIDTPTSITGPSGKVFRGAGESGMTLGEVKNRADLVIYWGVNPVQSYPRHMQRYAVDTKGMFIPDGKDDRTVVVIDSKSTASTKTSDVFLKLKPSKDFELLWILRALLKEQSIDSDVKKLTGIPMATLENLIRRMKNCRYGVIFSGMRFSKSDSGQFNLGALQALVTDLNEHTHFVARTMRGHGNVAGADNVLTWQTGYPYAVNFARGYPCFNSNEFTAPDLLSRKDADAAMIITSDPVSTFPATAIEQLHKIPLITLDHKDSATSKLARVSFRTSTYGIHTAGTVYRMDDVSLRLRPSLSSPLPDDVTILKAIANRLHAH